MEHNAYSKEILTLFVSFSKLGRKKFVLEDIHPGDMAVFGLLMKAKKINGQARLKMTELSQTMGISKAAATQAVNRLVDRGLLDREGDENDRRTVYIQMSDKGEKLFKRENDRVLAMIDKIIENMGEKDIEEFIRLYRKFQTAWYEMLDMEGNAYEECF